MTFRRLLLAIWVLIVRFWHEQKRKLETPMPPPVPSPIASEIKSKVPFPETRETKTAIHEAGHTIAAWFCTFIDDVKSARIEANGGEVRHSSSAFGADFTWCRMVIALAGVAAEAKVYKRWRSGEAKEDLMRVREFATKVVGTKPPWGVLFAPPQGFESVYKSPLSSDESHVIRSAYAMARLLLDKHEIRLYRCAGLLLHRRKITSSDLTAALGSRGFLRVAATSCGFWLP